jgi:hypothetical protein
LAKDEFCNGHADSPKQKGPPKRPLGFSTRMQTLQAWGSVVFLESLSKWLHHCRDQKAASLLEV